MYILWEKKNKHIIFAEAQEQNHASQHQKKNIYTPEICVFVGCGMAILSLAFAHPTTQRLKLPCRLLILGSNIIGFQGIAIDAYIT